MVLKYIKLVIAHIIVWSVISIILGGIVFVIYSNPILQGLSLMLIIMFVGGWIFNWAMNEVSK